MVLQPLRQTIRRLASSPVFTLLSIVTLALAIGATTAIFAVVDAVTGPPPGIPDVDRVLEVYHYPEGNNFALSWEDYQDLRTRQTAFESLTSLAVSPRSPTVANGVSETTSVEVVDGDYFRVTRARIAVGRPLQPADDLPDAPAAAVISAAFHQRVFAGSPDVVGQTMRLGGATFEVVGVAGAEFQGLIRSAVPPAVWIPMSAGHRTLNVGSFGPGERRLRWVTVRGRLAPRQTAAQARGQVETIAHQLDEEHPFTTGDANEALWSRSRAWGVRDLGLVLDRPSGFLSGLTIRGLLWSLYGALLLVLLVACTNLANLTVARHTERRSEVAIRGALGASRGRLMTEAMVEPLVLAAIGGVVGLGVARALTVLFSAALAISGQALPALPGFAWPVLVVALGATLLAALVGGAIPAWRASGPGLQAVLAGGGAGAVPRWRGRRHLIAVQVMVSVFLVSLGWLFVVQVRQEFRIDPGIDLEHLAVMQVDFGAQQYDTIRSRTTADAAIGRIVTTPDVVAATAISGLPFGLNVRRGTMAVPGTVDPVNPSPGTIVPAIPVSTSVNVVAGDTQVFDTLGVTISDGRAFHARDATASSSEVVLSVRVADQLFPEGQAIGRAVTLTRQGDAGAAVPEVVTIVGLAADADGFGVGTRTNGVVYLPLDERPADRVLLVARTSGDPAAAVPMMRQVLRSIDSELAVGPAGTGLALAGPDTSLGVLASLAGSLGALALVVALTGLYGVLSHVVGSRTREIGVRMALGATAWKIRRMVLVEGLTPVALGLSTGLGLGVIARAGLRPLFQRIVPAADMTLLVAVPLAFVAAGLVAAWLPARRAARVDPVAALRAE